MTRSRLVTIALIFGALLASGIGAPPEARGQDPASRPVNNARLLGSLAPGDTTGFADSALWTAAQRASAVVYAQASQGGAIYALSKRDTVYGALPWMGVPAGATPPRPRPGQANPQGPQAARMQPGVTPYPARNDMQVVGFEVPQLPLGDYVVWVENGPAASSPTAKPFQQALRIEPTLIWLASSERVLLDTELELRIGIAGPRYAPPLKGSLNAQLSQLQKFSNPLRRQGQVSLALPKAQQSAATTIVVPGRGPVPAAAPVRATVSLAGFSPDVLTQLDPPTPPTSIEVGQYVVFRFTTTATTRAGVASVRFDAAGFNPAIARIEKYLPPPPPPPPPGKIMPIVFVPGTAGSYLRYSDGQPLWLTEGNMTKRFGGRASSAFARAALDANGGGGTAVEAPKVLGSLAMQIDPGVKLASSYGGAIQPVQIEEVYAGFLAWAEQRFRTTGGRSVFYTAPYDWRKAGSIESARAIDAVVERARRENHADQVILVSHSLGGIVSRDYLRRLQNREAGLGGLPTKVAQLIAVGTPWLGAPKTARALLWGYNFDVGEAAYDDDDRYLLVGKDGEAEFKISNDRPASALRYPVRLSLIDLNRCKELAKNWPAVWQQLPSPEFHEFYQKARTSKAVNRNRIPKFTSVYGWTQADYDAFLTRTNPTLKAQTQAWRAQMFGAFDFGVPHFLIAGTVHPNATGVGDTTDMQIARPQHLPASLRNLGQPVTQAGLFFKQWTDEYFATDSGKNWGDGTSPLLSASAGAFLDGAAIQTINLPRLRALLGPGADAVRVVLNSYSKADKTVYYGHSSMLDDTSVRDRLWQRVIDLYAEKNTPKLGGLDPKVVRTMKIEVRTKSNQRPWNDYGTYHVVRANFRGLVLPLNADGNGSALGLGSGETLTVSVQDASIMDEHGWWRRPIETDFEGHTLKFGMIGSDDWVSASVRFYADGKRVLDDQRDFRLNGDNSRTTSAMSKP